MFATGLFVGFSIVLILALVDINRALVRIANALEAKEKREAGGK